MFKRLLIVILPFALGVILTTVFEPLKVAQLLANSLGAESGTCQTFRETGKTVCGPFLVYWQQHGGVMQLGYPVSEPFIEVSDMDNMTYTVQYFERALLELHPKNKPPYDVLLGQLGTSRYRSKYPHGEPEPPPLLDHIPRYPDAAGIKITNYDDVIHPNVVMEYTTKAQPAEVFAFYKEVLLRNGWELNRQIDPSILAFYNLSWAPTFPAYDLSVIVTPFNKTETKVQVLLRLEGPG